MILHRSSDPGFLTQVANHPDVRPHVGAEGPISFRVADHDVILQGEHGGFFFQRIAPGLFEVHSLVLPEGRGRWSHAAMLEARDAIFTATDCVELVTKVADANRPALGLTRLAGMHMQFRREDVGYWSISWIEAAVRSASLRLEGLRFHDWLESVGMHEDHPHDDAHDAVVGACLKRARLGLPSVALALYNRWAIFAGYASLTLVSQAPIRFAMDKTVVQLDPDGTLELVECPSGPLPESAQLAH